MRQSSSPHHSKCNGGGSRLENDQGRSEFEVEFGASWSGQLRHVVDRRATIGRLRLGRRYAHLQAKEANKIGNVSPKVGVDQRLDSLDNGSRDGPGKAGRNCLGSLVSCKMRVEEEEETTGWDVPPVDGFLVVERY